MRIRKQLAQFQVIVADEVPGTKDNSITLARSVAVSVTNNTVSMQQAPPAGPKPVDPVRSHAKI